MTRIPVNGIELNVEVEGKGPAVLLLHGFTGDVSTWDTFLPVLGGFETVRIDLIGHGASDAPEEPHRYSMDHAVEDICAILDHFRLNEIGLLGYSLGGRVALHFALRHPERLWGLVLESASPGIESADERRARIASDEALASDLLRDGIEPFIDRWQSQALFASQSSLPAEVQERQRRLRLSQSPLGLANSLRGMGAGRQDYLMPELGRINVSTMLIAGELDTKYAALTQEMAAMIPDVGMDVVPGAGHAVHMEAPERFSRVAGTFLMLVISDIMGRRHQEMHWGRKG